MYFIYLILVIIAVMIDIQDEITDVINKIFHTTFSGGLWFFLGLVVVIIISAIFNI